MHQREGICSGSPGVLGVRGADSGVSRYRSSERARLPPSITGRLPLSLLLAANPALGDVAAG